MFSFTIGVLKTHSRTDNFTNLIETTFTDMGNWTEAHGPRLLAGVAILIVGWIVAKLSRMGLVRLLKLAKIDTMADKTGFDDFLKRGNIKGSSVTAIGKVFYWVLLLVTILLSLSTMGLDGADEMVGKVVAIIPGLILAVIILILGVAFAKFLGDLVQVAAANAQISQARLLANITKYTATLMIVLLALGQLKIDTGLLTNAFLVLFGAICLGMALAFGLGCRDLAKEMTENFWNREKATRAAIAAAQQAVQETPEDTADSEG